MYTTNNLFITHKSNIFGRINRVYNRYEGILHISNYRLLKRQKLRISATNRILYKHPLNRLYVINMIFFNLLNLVCSGSLRLKPSSILQFAKTPTF